MTGTTTSALTSSSSWHIGQFVQVSSLTTSGLNREGGHARIVDLHYSSSGGNGGGGSGDNNNNNNNGDGGDNGVVVVGIDVKFTLWNSIGKMLDPSDVTPHETLERGNRSRRPREFLIEAADPNASFAAPPKKKIRRDGPKQATAKDNDDDDDDDDDAPALHEEEEDEVVAGPVKRKKPRSAAAAAAAAKKNVKKSSSSNRNSTGENEPPANTAVRHMNVKNSVPSRNESRLKSRPVPSNTTSKSKKVEQQQQQQQQQPRSSSVPPRKAAVGMKADEPVVVPVVVVEKRKTPRLQNKIVTQKAAPPPAAPVSKRVVVKNEATKDGLNKKKQQPHPKPAVAVAKERRNALGRAAPSAAKTTSKGMTPKNAVTTSAVLPAGIPHMVIASGDSAVSPLAHPDYDQTRMEVSTMDEAKPKVIPTNKRSIMDMINPAVAGKPVWTTPSTNQPLSKQKATDGGTVAPIMIPNTAYKSSDDATPKDIINPAATKSAVQAEATGVATWSSHVVTNIHPTPVLSDEHRDYMVSKIAQLLRSEADGVVENAILQELNQHNRWGKIFTGEELEGILNMLFETDRIFRSGGMVYSLL